MADALPSFVRIEGTQLLIDVHLQPGARKNEIAGVHGGRLKLRIAAPPVEGAANRAVCAYIAELFGIARGQVQLVRGERSRQKTLVLVGTAALPASIASLG